MVLIPSGEFTMGSDFIEDEEPERIVFLDTYLIGKCPVTVGHYAAYCKDQHIDFAEFREPDWGWKSDHPMVNISWQKARDFCLWAGGDLPTEAQWEKAARGPNGLKYPWGNEFDDSKLWCSVRIQKHSTASVGSYTSLAELYVSFGLVSDMDRELSKIYPDSATALGDRGLLLLRAGLRRLALESLQLAVENGDTDLEVIEALRSLQS